MSEIEKVANYCVRSLASDEVSSEQTGVDSEKISEAIKVKQEFSPKGRG